MGKQRRLFSLPEELLYEILSWSDVKSALRCKSVSKLWYAVIEDQEFVKLHMLRRSHSHNIGEEWLKIGPVCRSQTGLIVQRIVSSTSALPRYRISNPSIQRTLDIPNPHYKLKRGMSIFRNSSTSSYNVVSIYFDEKKEVCVEVLDLGGQSKDPNPNKDLSWTSIKIPDFDNQHRYRKSSYYQSEGVLYILALLKVGSSKPKIICFDMINQASTILDAPQSLCSIKSSNIDLCSWRRKPSLISVLEDKLNVWVLEDYQKHNWAATIIIPLPFLQKIPKLTETVPAPSTWWCHDEEDLLVYTGKGTQGCLVYNLESKQLRRLPSVPKNIPATLASVKGMQPFSS